MNGEDDTRRRESIPIRLVFGERPAAAGAEKGALGFCVEGRAASRRLGVRIGLERDVVDEIVSLNTKCETLAGLTGYPSTFLAFLEGDFQVEGSIFSESMSSNDGD